MIGGNVNVILRAADGSTESPAGKVVGLGGVWLYHVWLNQKWQRRDAGAWGLSEAVVEFLRRERVSRIAAYAPWEDATYQTHLHRLDILGVKQKGGQYGVSVNLPLLQWRKTPGRLVDGIKVPWVPDDCRVVVLADLEAGRPPVWEDEPVSPATAAPVVAPVPVVREPEPQQLALTLF